MTLPRGPDARRVRVQILPMAAAFVGYIVFWNLSLQLNSVGFYQLSKILIAPAIILIEAVWFKKVPTRLELASVGVLCMGVTLATVSDSEVRGWHGYLHAWFRLPQALTCRSSLAQCPLAVLCSQAEQICAVAFGTAVPEDIVLMLSLLEVF